MRRGMEHILDEVPYSVVVVRAESEGAYRR